MEHGSVFRQLDRGDRIDRGNRAMSKFVELMNDAYDLSPLTAFCEIMPGFDIIDCSGTQEDFQGTDIRLGVGGPRIQDKRRLSGVDIGVEFCRMYLYWANNAHNIVCDGGRDIYQIPYKWVEITRQFGGYKVKREWTTTETISDYWVLHPLNSNDTMWLKSSSVKAHAQSLLHKWRKMCTPESDVAKKILKTFYDGTTRNFRDEMGTNFDIKGIKEARDEKWICFDDDGQMSPIAKTICYLPRSLFVEGEDYVICPRK